MSPPSSPRRKSSANCSTGARGSLSGNPLPRLIDVGDLAKMLHVEVVFVRRLVFERRIPYVKVGKFVRFDPAEVTAWLDERRVAPEPDHPAWGSGR